MVQQMKRRIFTEDGEQAIPNMQADQPGRKRFASEEERLAFRKEIKKRIRKQKRERLLNLIRLDVFITRPGKDRRADE